jgi:hypothetical protein
MADRKVPVALVKTALDVVKEEKADTIREIRETREKLDEFTLRDFADGLFGEDYAHMIYGAEGGNIKMGDLKFNMTGSPKEGEALMQLNREQMITIMMEAHPNLERHDVILMLTESPEVTNPVLLRYLAEQEEVIDDAVERTHKEHQKFMMDEAKKGLKDE